MGGGLGGLVFCFVWFFVLFFVPFEMRISSVCNQCKRVFLTTTPISNFLCRKCLSKHLPFYGATNNQIMLLFQNTIKEIIKLFSNVHFDRISDNIENCKYFQLDDGKKLFSNHTESNHFSAIHVNIVSLETNLDKIKTMIYGLNHKPDLIAVTETR